MDASTSGRNIAISHIEPSSLVTSPARYARPEHASLPPLFSSFFFDFFDLSSRFCDAIPKLKANNCRLRCSWSSWLSSSVSPCLQSHALSLPFSINTFFFLSIFAYLCISVKFEAQAPVLSFWLLTS